MNASIQLTNWNWPFAKIETKDGRIPFREWCEREVKRAAAAGKKFFITEGDGPYRGRIRLERQGGGE